MSYFTITSSGTKGTIELGSTNGYATGSPQQAYLSVGAPYSVSVSAPTFGGCAIFKVNRVTFAWTSGNNVFIRKVNPDTNTTLTSYSKNLGMIEGNSKSDPSGTLLTTYDWFVQNPAGSVVVDFFVGIPTNGSTYSDSLSVTAHYDNGTQDNFQFGVNSGSPSTNNSTTLNFSHPITYPFQFGPWYVGDNTQHPELYANTPTSWSDPLYWAGATDYALGCQAGGVSPWSFSGLFVNNTFCTGTAYCTQLGRIRDSSEIVFAHTGFNKHTTAVIFVLKVNRIIHKYDVFPNAPKDVSGNTYYGCDVVPGSSSSHPWAYQQNAFTVPTPNGGVTVVPPPNSTQDVNGNNQSYYSDNPGLLEKVITATPYSTVDIEFNYDTDYKTYLVWEPDGGIPIGMAIQQWSLRCNTYNPTADASLIWSDGRAFQNYWSVGSGTSSNVYSAARGPFYLVWPYFLGDFSTAISTFRDSGWFISSSAPNGGGFGVSSFGGAPSMAPHNGHGLWNGGSGNIAGPNTVVMG